MWGCQIRVICVIAFAFGLVVAISGLGLST
jgi:hypothetical protein